MPDHDYQVLDDVLAHIRAEHPTVARRWFDELEPLGIVSGTFGVRAHSDLHRDYLRRNGLDAFNDAVRSVTGQLIAVRLLGPDDEWISATKHAESTKQAAEKSKGTSEDPREDRPGSIKSDPHADIEVLTSTSSFAAGASTPSKSKRHVSSERARLDHDDALPINPDYGFEQFVIGENNQIPHAAAIAVSENPGHAYNPLFIHGGVGLGKTHLLQAICLRIKQQHPGITMRYLSCDGFMTQYVNAVQSARMVEFRHAFRDIDLLVIDDIHFLSKRDRTQDEFFHTFNALYQTNKQIIISADLPPEDIPDLEDRLVSRFLWGLVVKIEKPGFETRVEILKRKAHDRGLELPDKVASEIAQHIDTNIRELEGAITKLQIVASIEKNPIDLDLTRRALGAEFAAPATVSGQGPTIEHIISEVSAFFHIKQSDLLGKRRHKSVAHPRQIGMYLTRQLTKHSLEEIGAHFGGRDHTTVMHAVRSISNKCKDDSELLGQIRTLESRLKLL